MEPASRQQCRHKGALLHGGRNSCFCLVDLKGDTSFCLFSGYRKKFLIPPYVSVSNRRPEQNAQDAVCKEQPNQNKTACVNCAFRHPAEQLLAHRLQQVMKRQSQKAEAHHTSKADNPVNVKEQPTVVPQPQAEIPDADITDDLLYHTGNRDTKQKQPHRVLLQRLQCIDSKGSDSVDRQPGPIQNAPVPEQSFRDPIEDLLINPSHKAANEEDQEKITQPIHGYPSAIILDDTAFHFCPLHVSSTFLNLR